MGRRLLSHLLITLAIFSLSATYFIWVVDTVVLNPKKLHSALQDGGVPSALASAIPDQATSDNGDNKDTSAEDKADMKAKISAVVTPQYIDDKLNNVSYSLITYLKQGEPTPTIDLSDFPQKLRESGVDTGEDIDKNFSKPIELKNDALATLPKAYSLLKIAKYVGIVLCLLLLVAEYFVAQTGNRMHLIGRIFLHVAFWYSVWSATLWLVPKFLLPKLHASMGANESIQNVVDAVVHSLQKLIGTYFIGFAIVCWVVAIVLYLLRHGRKHVAAIQAVPAAKTKPAPKK